MPKLCSLPATDPAFMEKLKKAHFQICIWKHALDLNVPDLNLVQYGWTKDKATKSLAAVHVIIIIFMVTFQTANPNWES